MKFMRVFINPGHDRKYDSGACHPSGVREADVAWDVGERLEAYLQNAGCETYVMQSDNLNGESTYWDRQDAVVCPAANDWGADVFVSIHCNACNGEAQGTETLMYAWGGASETLAACIQNQIVSALGTIDRGLRERPRLSVLRNTDMPAVLVELGFIDNDEDLELLLNHSDEFAAAIARGITDYQQAQNA